MNKSSMKLENYAKVCKSIKEKHVLGRYVSSSSDTKILQNLHHLLDEVYCNLDRNVISAIITNLQQISADVLQLARKNSGFHSARSDCNLKVPRKVDKPHLYMEGPQLRIQVNDNRNYRKDLDEYEISIDKEQIYHLKSGRDDSGPCDIAIIEPEGMNPPLEPGKLYSFQVLAVNAKGLGEWSESATIRLDTGILGKPGRPVISDRDTSGVEVRVGTPQTYTNHVNEVVFQYHDVENGGQWSSANFNIPEKLRPTAEIRSLINLPPQVHYRLRTSFVNKFAK